MTADIVTVSLNIGNAVFIFHLQSGFFSSRGKRWQVLHCHPDCEIHFFEKGEFDFYSGGAARHVSSPSALILRPLVYHSFYSESEDADRACLLLELKRSGDGEAFGEYSKLLSSLSEHTFIPDFDSCFSKYRSRQGSLRPFEETELLKNELSGALIRLFARLREMKEPKETRTPSLDKSGKSGILADIFKYIEDNFSKDPTPAKLASSLFISQRQLERLLKNVMQTTFTELLNRCRIENVCKQLDRDTDAVRLARLAEESGFPDYTTFWRNFKKYTGKSPTEYVGEKG